MAAALKDTTFTLQDGLNKTLKIHLCNVHAKTRKLWKHSARAASTIEIATNIRSP